MDPVFGFKGLPHPTTGSSPVTFAPAVLVTFETLTWSAFVIFFAGLWELSWCRTCRLGKNGISCAILGWLSTKATAHWIKYFLFLQRWI